MSPSAEITPERILEIEYNQKSLAEHMMELKQSVEEERAENKTFQTTILEKLDDKPNFNLSDTLKTVLVTIGIIGAITAGIDYRIESNVAPLEKEQDHRKEETNVLRELVKESLKISSEHTILLSGNKDGIERNSNFIDDFMHVKEYPLKINTLQKDVEMLQYQMKQRK